MTDLNTRIASTVGANTSLSTSLSTSQVPAKPLAATVLQDALAKAGEELGYWKAYSSQLPITEIEGTRIVKALYKKHPKTGEQAQPNSYVRVPTRHLSEELVVNRIVELVPYVLTWLQGIEDKELQAKHKIGNLSVMTQVLSIDSLMETLEQQGESGRLTKDRIEAWFDDVLMQPLTDRFADKMGISEHSTEAEMQKLQLVLDAYKGKFASLASPKVYLKVDDCVAMSKVVVACEPDADSRSLLGRRFMSKLEKMQVVEVDELMGL